MSRNVPIRPRPRPGPGRTLVLMEQIRRVHEANFGVYGARKVWRQLRPGGHRGGALHGGAPDAADGPARRRARQGGQDHDRRQGRALPGGQGEPAVPGAAAEPLWVSDFTYVATWQGFVYVAFVIDVFARRIVGWRVSRTAHAGFVLDALEQALHDRRPVEGRPDPPQRQGRRNTFRFATRNASPRPASSPPSAASATATTTRWPRRSSACSRPR